MRTWGTAAVLLFAAAGPLFADEKPPPAREEIPKEAVEPPERGWWRKGASLLLFDAEGFLLKELGVGRWIKPISERVEERSEMRGRATRDGRFAWHWRETETVRTGREETVLASSRALVYLGTAGQALWTNDLADAPDGLDPVLQSRDGETAVVLERNGELWTAAAYAFTGNRLLKARIGERLVKARITRNGRYAMVLGSGRDAPLMYSFFDLRKGARHDIPAAEAPLGEASIGEDGTIALGSKRIDAFMDLGPAKDVDLE